MHLVFKKVQVKTKILNLKLFKNLNVLKVLKSIMQVLCYEITE